MSGVIIAERADIHKSCKSVELLVNLLNDYSQLTNAVLATQKKLVKALKEAAATKATPTIPGELISSPPAVTQVHAPP